MFKIALYAGIAFILYIVFKTGSIWMLPILWAALTYMFLKWGTERKQEGGVCITGIPTKGNLFASSAVAAMGIPLLCLVWPIAVIYLAAQPAMEAGK